MTVRKSRTQTPQKARDLTVYRNDPIGFARDVLRVELTESQRVALLALLEEPGRVLVKSGHNIGKTFLAAVVVVWWYYTRPDSVVITTAPTQRDVVDLLWTEIRLLVARGGLPDHFVGPAAAEMRDPDNPEEHWAKGYTATKGESFQGRHRSNMLFVFDEAEGVDATYWKTTNTMFKPGDGHAWLTICNPTTTTSQRYQEEKAFDLDGNRKWRVFSFSALDHPNILAELAGNRPPVPNAVSVSMVRGWLGDWFEPVAEPDPATDIEFPPGSGQWYRPGPEGESRVLGRNPSAGVYGVWSEAIWARAIRLALEAPVELPEIGCDVARYGDDKTEIHSRCGPVSLEHEEHSGWDTVRTATRLAELADYLAAWHNKRRPSQAAPVLGKSIPIKVDDTGVGGGVTDILISQGYNAIPVNAGRAADDDSKYPLVRDELWFTTAARAKSGQLSFILLPKKLLARLESQALAPSWKPTVDRRRRVESKEETKKRIGRSPDGMDAVNLAYYQTGTGDVAEWIETDDGVRKSRTRR